MVTGDSLIVLCYRNALTYLLYLVTILCYVLNYLLTDLLIF